MVPHAHAGVANQLYSASPPQDVLHHQGHSSRRPIALPARCQQKRVTWPVTQHLSSTLQEFVGGVGKEILRPAGLWI